MEYLTPEEIAQKWDISARRVTAICMDGRIDGATQKGRVWLKPNDVHKPEGMKRGRKSNRGEDSDRK
ncbi:MAG: DNA-binding protein [Lachnospiraceae bacterium]|nr:DNA-binding protein [Lachnospiraceae bacterium]